MAFIVKVAFDTAKKKLRAIKEGMEFVRDNTVAVGIFSDNDAAHSGGLTNSQLLYLHCNGSPANNIPARDVLSQGIAEAKQNGSVQKCLNAGILKALAGNVDQAKAEYEKAGMAAAAAVQAQFGKIGPPLSPVTVARKGSSATLIDTGALRQAITYKVMPKSAAKGGKR